MKVQLRKSVTPKKPLQSENYINFTLVKNNLSIMCMCW